jgi:pimeloyl-ACP methyl ester carboxylesterase
VRARILLLLLAVWPPIARAEPPRWQTLPAPPVMPEATTTGHVDSDGVAIYYATYGRAGEPVILLHGGLGNADHWAFQVPALARRHRVIAIDSRHQGRSGFGTQPLSYRAMAGDVVRVMDALGVPSAALVGWSDGGQIALELAIHHSKRVRRMFVFGSTYDATGNKPKARTRTFDGYATRCRGDFQRLSKTPRKWGAAVDALRAVWRSSPAWSAAELKAIATPTVVAIGDHDEIVRLEHARQMASLIPRARLVVFEDTSHFALWQDPEGFTRAVLEFLGPDGPPRR